MTDLRDTRCFKIKKWVLFAICLIFIILMIAAMFLSSYFAEYAYDDYIKSEQHLDESDYIHASAYKDKMQRIIIVMAILSIITDLFGVIGAYKEHLCLSLTFAILVSIWSIYRIVLFLIAYTNYPQLLVNLAINILAFAFVRDLYRVRAQMSAHPMVTVKTTTLSVPQTVIPLVSTAAFGQQMYPQQQQQQQNNADMDECGDLPPKYSDILSYIPNGV